jgi:peptidoglycan-associated lipoprotein
VWTASDQPGVVTATVTVQDGRGGSATSSVDVQVIQREAIEFAPVYFDFDMSVIRPDGIVTLDGVVVALQVDADLTIRIEGHTDNVGTLEYNLALGERRATAVYDYLVNRGVAAARMQTVSFGEESPAAPNDTPANGQLNRRADIVIVIQ